LINSGVELTEEKVHRVLGLLTGTYEDTKASGEKRASEYEEDLRKKGEWVKGRGKTCARRLNCSVKNPWAVSSCNL
jgi:hypothetical protein